LFAAAIAPERLWPHQGSGKSQLQRRDLAAPSHQRKERARAVHFFSMRQLVMIEFDAWSKMSKLAPMAFTMRL
jgi:hypothetical protein